MACERHRILHQLVGLGAHREPSKRGGITVDWTTILALVIAVAPVIYLAAALLAPEKFS